MVRKAAVITIQFALCAGLVSMVLEHHSRALLITAIVVILLIAVGVSRSLDRLSLHRLDQWALLIGLISPLVMSICMFTAVQRDLNRYYAIESVLTRNEPLGGFKEDMGLLKGDIMWAPRGYTLEQLESRRFVYGMFWGFSALTFLLALGEIGGSTARSCSQEDDGQRRQNAERKEESGNTDQR